MFGGVKLPETEKSGNPTRVTCAKPGQPASPRPPVRRQIPTAGPIITRAAESIWGRANNGSFPGTEAIRRYDSETGRLEQSFGRYNHGHHMKFIRRGAVRIGSTASSQELSHVAFRNPNGELVLVLANTTGLAKPIVVAAGARHFPATVPGKSVMTCVWRLGPVGGPAAGAAGRHQPSPREPSSARSRSRSHRATAALRRSSASFRPAGLKVMSVP